MDSLYSEHTQTEADIISSFLLDFVCNLMMIMSVYGNRFNVAHCNRIQMRDACTMCARTNLARYRISMDVNKCRQSHQMHRLSFWFHIWKRNHNILSTGCIYVVVTISIRVAVDWCLPSDISSSFFLTTIPWVWKNGYVMNAYHSRVYFEHTKHRKT